MSLPFFFEPDGSLSWSVCPHCSSQHPFHYCCCNIPSTQASDSIPAVCRSRNPCAYTCSVEVQTNAKETCEIWNTERSHLDLYLAHGCIVFDSTVKKQCAGLSEAKYAPLFFCDLQGSFPPTEFELISKTMIEGTPYLMAAGYPHLHYLCRKIRIAGSLGSISDVEEVIRAIPAKLQIPAWVGYSHCVRSTMCAGSAPAEASACLACTRLGSVEGKYHLVRRLNTTVKRLEELKQGQSGLTGTVLKLPGTYVFH